MTKAEVTMKLQKKLRSRGSAALLAITAALPLIGVAGTLLMVTVRQRDQVEAAAIVAAARDAAASGAQDAMAKLALDPNYTGTYDLTVGSSLAHVVVTAWSTDGVDNDGNGKVDDLAEADYISVTSEGRVNVAYDRQGHEMDTAAMSQTKDAGSVVKKTKIDIAVNSAFCPTIRYEVTSMPAAERIRMSPVMRAPQRNRIASARNPSASDTESTAVITPAGVAKVLLMWSSSMSAVMRASP